MARQTATLSADGQSTPFQIYQRADELYEASAFLFGSAFGGGTLILQLSPDNGTTWFTAKDIANNAVSATTNSYFNLRVPAKATSNSNAFLARWSLSGATDPVLTPILIDNR